MNYTNAGPPDYEWQVIFKHSLTLANGYGWERLPYPDCTEGWQEHRGIAWYPNGTRLNPDTLNLRTVISEITTVPVGLVLPDVIKISNGTIVSWDKTAQILRPEEDTRFYEICGYVSGGVREQDILNRLG